MQNNCIKKLKQSYNKIGDKMRNDIKERVILAANLLIDNNSNIRDIAKQLGYSKSTIHIDLSIRLKELNSELFQKIKTIFINNQNEKHLRGGLSTKLKYLK